MVSSWQPIIITIIVLAIGRVSSKEGLRPSDWTVIELLAEEHPYVVALLNSSKDYVCTGTVVSERTVLTAGSCLELQPSYVCAGAAVVANNNNTNNIFPIDRAVLHEDYTYQLKPAEPNGTRTHSNIALLMTVQPFLESLRSSEFGRYYASELKEKHLVVIGYGKLTGGEAVALQKQAYHQTPCVNPKWYYCVCGFEYSTHMNTYEQEFGQGAPVLYGTEIVAITASACGVLLLPVVDIKYNIFTVIGPYMKWIDKTHADADLRVGMHAVGSVSAIDEQQEISLKNIFVLLVISKILI